MELSIIIVNWNVCNLLRRCLASINANRGDLSLEVIVVDNVSSDDSVQMVSDEFPHVRLMASRENLGYTGGNNLGAREARGRYLLILNPDTEIVGDALQQMVAYLEAHPNVGLIGPKLYNSDGTVQASRYHFPKLSLRYFNRPYECLINLQQDKVHPVDWMMGAVLVTRREMWDMVGGFDEEFFMYFEDVDLCRRYWDRGWQVHYVPLAQVIHYHKASASQLGVKRQLRFYRSQWLYFRKHFGTKGGICVRLFLWWDCASTLILEAAKWMVDHRASRVNQMHICWQLLKTNISVKV
jgi:N-acetylglucosaminyl-diphospho-decaprenol L-rhamnosyltransferase